MTSETYKNRFSGIGRLYGLQQAEIIRAMHVCIVGIGGVGSWAVEALVRSGVGCVTLIDYDTIAESNINRQIHAGTRSLDTKKCQALADRVKDINPDCECRIIDDYLTADNLFDYMSTDYDYVIDAIDSIKFKSAMIYHCKRNKIPIITTGGAGGLTDPTQIGIRDLNKTYNDPLAAKVRSQLRSSYGFTRNTKRYFGIECVYSTEQQRYPKEDGSIGFEKPGIHGISMDCNFAYGSVTMVTGTFGFIAAARVIEKTLKKKMKAK